MKPKPMPSDAAAGTLLADTRAAAPPLRVPAQQSAHSAVLQHLADLRPAVASLVADGLVEATPEGLSLPR